MSRWSHGDNLNAAFAAFGTLTQAFVARAADAAKEAVTAGTATALTASMAPWLGPVGVMLNALAGVGINRIASRVDRSAALKEATRSLLVNESLAHAVAQAIEARLKEVAQLVDSRDLLAIATGAQEWWPAVMREGVGASDKVEDRIIVERIAEELSGRPTHSLTAVEWRNLLSMAHGYVGNRGDLDPQVLDAASRRLEETFIHDAVESLKKDAAVSGEAFASVVLRFLSTLLFDVRAISEQMSALTDKLDESLSRETTGDLRRAFAAGENGARLLGCDDLERQFQVQLTRIEATLLPHFDRLERVGQETFEVVTSLRDADARGTVPAAGSSRTFTRVTVMAVLVAVVGASSWAMWRNKPATTEIVGTWVGTLAFVQNIPISVEFAPNAEFHLRSSQGDVASGQWSSKSAEKIHIEARHRSLGLFTCDLVATAGAIKGPCLAGGRPAGMIDLSNRRE